MKGNESQVINLGWTNLPEDVFNASDCGQRLDLYFKLYAPYGWIFAREENQLHRYGRYELTTPSYLDEIEDVVRHGLLLFDKIVIEVPSPKAVSNLADNSPYDWDYYAEGKTYCEYSFFTRQSLLELQKSFGDAIQDKEIAVLPSFYPQWEDPEWDEETGYISAGTPPYEVADLMKPFGYAWPRLAQCQELVFQEAALQEAESRNLSISLPIIVGGRIRDLISLRRDEANAFGRWRSYLDEVVNSKHFNQVLIAKAINEGLNELNDRIAILKRKGLLDVLGATMISASVLAACMLENQPLTLSSSIAALSITPPILKSLVEQRAEKRQIQRDSLYFLWVARRLWNWRD